jgi:hypothetical protein
MLVAVAAFLILAVPVSLAGWFFGSAISPGHRSPTDPSRLQDVLTGCDSTILRPYSHLAPGQRGCGNLVLGSQLFSVDCAKRSSIQQANLDVAVSRFGEAQPGQLNAKYGTCLMTAGSGEIVQIAPTQVEAGDGIFVLDFAASGWASTEVGLRLRCSQSTCVGITVNSKGEYGVREAAAEADGTITTTIKAKGGLGPDQFWSDYPNRLLVRAKGGTLDVFINGIPLYRGHTEVSKPGLLIISNHNTDESKTSVVWVKDLQIFKTP